MTNEPRHHTIGGDINRTLRVETFDLTATEWERWLAEDRKRGAASLAHYKTSVTTE
jgi:hypothetical protein